MSIANWYGSGLRARILLVILTAIFARWVGYRSWWVPLIRPLGVLSCNYLTWWLRATNLECTASSVEELFECREKLFLCEEVRSGMAHVPLLALLRIQTENERELLPNPLMVVQAPTRLWDSRLFLSSFLRSVEDSDFKEPWDQIACKWACTMILLFLLRSCRSS